MAGEKNPLGPTGTYVQKNVKRLREERNLSLAELSRRLDKIGRKIPTLGLSRIENGERRVDTDDLVALAAVLDVSPVTLMLPAEDPGEPVKLTQGLTVRHWSQAWRWMHGEVPLLTKAGATGWPRRLSWMAENRPYMTEEQFMDKFTSPAPISVEAMEEEGEDNGPGS
jgi:transcriptional regulator with XRE-family HTH domain